MGEKLESKDLWVWVGAAMLAPMAQWLGGSPWLWTLTVALGAGILFLWTEMITAGSQESGRFIAFLQLLFLMFAVIVTTAFVEKCWQTAKAGWTIPVVLLALAACSARRGNGAAQRAGATVIWFVGLGFVILAAFALPDAQVRYLYPSGQISAGGELPVLLVPGVALLFPRKKGRSLWLWVLVLIGAAVLISLLTAGVLSPWVAARTPGAFLEMVRGIQVLGAAERFEALVAAIMTLSWFSLLSLFLSAAGEMGDRLLPGKRKVFVWITAGLGAAFYPLGEKIPAVPAALGALVLWYIIPAIEALVKRKG